MIKKIFILLAVIIVIIAVSLYIYRYTIVQYYAIKIIRENLPPYITIDKIKFDLRHGAVTLSAFKIFNPPGFPSKYVLEIDSLGCKYKLKGHPIPDGIEVSEAFIRNPFLKVERLKSGQVNLVEMQNFINSLPPKQVYEPQAAPSGKADTRAGKGMTVAGRKLSDIIKLPSSFAVKNARIDFLDMLPYNRPHLISIDGINGEVSMSFNDSYSKMVSLSFTLQGDLNDTRDETIKWAASLNPLAPKITMSNRFEVSNLDIIAFEPYYDSLSPFVFKKGKFSGTLVFDFNNGQIGSTNEIRLSHIAFYVKPGYENAQMWQTSVPDLMRYFSTPSGDIVFDFKLKGDMKAPTLYLGPISKRALTSMAVDKIASYAIDQVTKQEGAGSAPNKTDEYINLLKGILKK